MDDFDQFWSIFEALRKPLNARDKAMACRQWLSYDESEHPKILAWAQGQARTRWRSPEYTPLPVNALINQGWTRVVVSKAADLRKDLCIRCGQREWVIQFLCGPCYEEANHAA